MHIEDWQLRSYIPADQPFDWVGVMHQIERVEPDRWQSGDRAHLAIFHMRNRGMIEQVGKGVWQLKRGAANVTNP